MSRGSQHFVGKPLHTLRLLLGFHQGEMENRSHARQDVPRKGPKRQCCFCKNYSCTSLSPGQTQDTGWGEKFQFRKDSRDLAETQEMEQHHLEANIGKAEASPSDFMNVCEAFIAFQKINE